MRFSGILFDLFGTIVPPFPRREHTDVMRHCAECMGIEFEDCHRLWRESFPQRIRGSFKTIAENFDWIARQCDCKQANAHLDAARQYGSFTDACLHPVSGAVELLQWLRERGLRIGLVT